MKVIWKMMVRNDFAKWLWNIKWFSKIVVEHKNDCRTLKWFCKMIVEHKNDSAKMILEHKMIVRHKMILPNDCRI